MLAGRSRFASTPLAENLIEKISLISGRKIRSEVRETLFKIIPPREDCTKKDCSNHLTHFHNVDMAASR